MSDDLINSKKNNLQSIIQTQENVFNFYVSFAKHIVYFIITLIFVGCPILYNCKIAQSGILTGIYNNVTISKDRGFCSPFNTVSEEMIANESVLTTNEDEKKILGTYSANSQSNMQDSSIPIQIPATLQGSVPNIPTDVIVFLLKVKDSFYEKESESNTPDDDDPQSHIPQRINTPTPTTPSQTEDGVDPQEKQYCQNFSSLGFRSQQECEELQESKKGRILLGGAQNDDSEESENSKTIYQYWYKNIKFDYASNIEKVLYIFGSKYFSNFVYLYLTSSSWVKYKVFDNKKKFTYDSLYDINKDNPVDWFVTPIINYVYYIAEYCADVGREYCAFNITMFQFCYETINRLLPDSVILFLPSFIIILSLMLTGNSSLFFTIGIYTAAIIQIIVFLYILYFSFIKFINYLAVFILENKPNYFTGLGFLNMFLNCFYIIYYLLKITFYIIIKIILASIIFHISLIYLSIIQFFLYFYTCFYIPYSFIATDQNNKKYTFFTLIKGLRFKQIWILLFILIILIYHLYKLRMIQFKGSYLFILVIFFLIIIFFGYFTNTLIFDNDSGEKYKNDKGIIEGKMSKYSFINFYKYSNLIEHGLTPHTHEEYKKDAKEKGKYLCNSKLGYTAQVLLEQDPRALNPDLFNYNSSTTDPSNNIQNPNDNSSQNNTSTQNNDDDPNSQITSINKIRIKNNNTNDEEKTKDDEKEDEPPKEKKKSMFSKFKSGVGSAAHGVSSVASTAAHGVGSAASSAARGVGSVKNRLFGSKKTDEEQTTKDEEQTTKDKEH